MLDAGSRWNGAIDEFAIFERALTADEIGVIYKSQVGEYAALGATLAFTPDVVGTYTVQLTNAPLFNYADVSTSADALIALPSDGGIYAFQGYSLLSLDPTGVHPILQGDFKDK